MKRTHASDHVNFTSYPEAGHTLRKDGLVPSSQRNWPLCLQISHPNYEPSAS